jgi:3-oxoacyl-ACP reductase-like protein
VSIFSSILNKIFPHDHPANAASGDAAAPAAAAPAATAAPATASTAAAAGSQPPVTPMPVVDVEAVLTDMQAKSSEKLNWQTSIVDLMKLLGLDSSLAARKELATELHYTGNTDDSATMNVWLHKQVMQKVAENGGKVPDSLKD